MLINTGRLIRCYKHSFLIANITDAKEINVSITVRVIARFMDGCALPVLIW